MFDIALTTGIALASGLVCSPWSENLVTLL
jgi:hypothetical protein